MQGREAKVITHNKYGPVIHEDEAKRFKKNKKLSTKMTDNVMDFTQEEIFDAI